MLLIYPLLLREKVIMNPEEEREIFGLPEKYRPLSPWAYFGYTILFAIPVVGFILLVVFSLIGGNVNRRNFARSYFCIYVLLFILFLIALLTGALTSLFASIF